MHLLLAAGSQAVHVVNNPALHVRVVNFPGPDPLALPGFIVALVTGIVAAVALVVAIIAARYAKGAFIAAEEDLKISRRSLAIAQRRPALVASFKVQGQYAGVSGSPPYRVLNTADAKLLATVANSAAGERRCDAFFIEVRVPLSALSFAAAARQLDLGETHFTDSDVVTGKVLFPSGQSVVVSFDVPLEYVTQKREVEIEYRMKDDFTTYPPEGYLTAKIELPTVDASMFLHPRDEPEAILLRMADQKRLMATDVGLARYREAINELKSVGRVTTAERTAKAKEIIATF